MKFFVIGKGFIFPKHKEAIEAVGGEIEIAVDKDQGEEKWKETLAESRADYVSILTPNHLHYKMIKESLKRGKIVLCEKPLVINSSHARDLVGENVFSVLQLRHHPLLEKIKKEQLVKKSRHVIKANICFQRDDNNYVEGWKNKKETSGGFLFNVGVHYFDILLHLFGEAKNFHVEKIYDKNDRNPKAEAKIKIEGENYFCDFSMFINKEEGGEIIKKREFIINGTPYNFSSKKNLAEENLHQFVYQDLIKRKGQRPEDSLKSIELIERLYQSYEK